MSESAYSTVLKESTSLGMGSRTFHPFPRLPKELRDAIWAFAMRLDSEQPGAHSFTVFDSSNDAEWSVLSQYSIRHQLVKRCSLAAPQQFSWVRGNRSTYLIDSGLWTACRESRDAMERRFKVAEWGRKRGAMSFPRPRKILPDAPAAVSFTSNGEWQCCLTFPKTDLFHLRPFDGTTVQWEYLWSPVPIFDPAEMFYVSHIAIDYDPGWLRDTDFLDDSAYWSPGTVVCAIRAASDELEWAENLWFVDYRIRRSRSPDALPTTTSRYQFHGNGCIFTEVREDATCWELDHTKPWDVFKFLEGLGDKVEEYGHARQGALSPRREGFSYSGNTPNVGVLAYEEV